MDIIEIRQKYIENFYNINLDKESIKNTLLEFIELDRELSKKSHIFYNYITSDKAKKLNLTSIVTKLYEEDRDFLLDNIFKYHLTYNDPIHSPLFRELLLNSLKNSDIESIKKMINHKFFISKYDYSEQLSFIYSKYSNIDKNIEHYFLDKFSVKDDYISNTILRYSNNLESILKILYNIGNNEIDNSIRYNTNRPIEIKFVLYINNKIINNLHLNDKDYINMLNIYKNIMNNSNISDKYKYLITKSFKQSDILSKIEFNRQNMELKI